MKSDLFGGFPDTKQGKEADSKKMLPELKENWAKTIPILYTHIKQWLTPFTERYQLRFNEIATLSSMADDLGPSKSLEIYFGNEKVTIIPEGKIGIGFQGRIEIRGLNGKTKKLFLSNGAWMIYKREQSIGRGERLTPSSTITPFEDSYVEVNEHTFKELIQEIIK